MPLPISGGGGGYGCFGDCGTKSVCSNREIVVAVVPIRVYRLVTVDAVMPATIQASLIFVVFAVLLTNSVPVYWSGVALDSADVTRELVFRFWLVFWHQKIRRFL